MEKQIADLPMLGKEPIMKKIAITAIAAVVAVASVAPLGAANAAGMHPGAPGKPPHVQPHQPIYKPHAPRPPAYRYPVVVKKNDNAAAIGLIGFAAGALLGNALANSR
ncbi:MAG: hypothetical protein MnENMB40S_10510 [Rhizobiaceae bacterium MnEN-MB40S]|nr:MAG: hypothetical protein MnENMB40S_10510 [Rhizobiaceae bacterium MnEN-MB40S]